MQGVLLVPQNQQGSPPPIDSEEMEPKKDKNQSDSGVFSSLNTDISRTDDSDNRSECSTPDRKFFCPICERMMDNQHDFTLHIRSHNNQSSDAPEAGFTCRICSKVLSSSSSLDRHVLVHTGERPFHCKYCGDTFTTNGNMHRHMRTHNNYESDCSDSSSKSLEYNNNNTPKRKLDETYTPSKKLLVSTPSSEQRFKCPVCERDDFNSLQNLEGHLEDNHPEYPTKCSPCNLTFNNNKTLQAHKLTHEPPKNPIIGFKDLTFIPFSSEKFPLIARYECEQNLHKVGSGLKFQCSKCSRAFPSAITLSIHQTNCLTISNGIDLSKPTEADMRRMDFFSRLNLQDASSESFKDQIKSIHDGKDLADIQSILTNINLQQIKKDEKNEDEESQDLFAVEFRKMKLRGEFPCRLCTAVFPNLRALKGHNRAHLNGTNNGTYHCNMCPHSSIDKAALIRHMRTHNGDRPYECSLCNYAFTTKANCERHLRNRHAKTTREEVKKSIIYHPSEDPTNEDLNKLTKETERKEIQHSTPKEKEKKLEIDPRPEPVEREKFGSIQVKSLDALKSFDSCEEEEPMDLVLDLSKKKKEEEVQDLSNKRSPPVTPQFNMNEIFTQHLLKASPKLDPATALYASQLAHLYRNVGLTPWSNGFGINPLLIPQLPQAEELKERMRLQMCGGGITDFKSFNYPNYEERELKVDTVDKMPSPKPELLQSPNSVKMVIKNGVLMPKQKQRRYRTERPFTCEHCSARFTLRSNMERHIKQQHPQFWSQRQRVGVGRKGKGYCDLTIPGFREEGEEKYAILAQQLRGGLEKKEEEEDCKLIIDEGRKEEEGILEMKLKEGTREESQDLVPVSRLLDNASQQQFKEYFKREEAEEAVSEEDEEGLVASGSTSEGTDENRSENEAPPVKKKSAYSLAPNRVSCPYCSRKFPWTSSLRRHILTHTGQKPFKCSHCPLLFTTKSNCDRHLLRKHGNAATTIATNDSNYLMRNVPERPFKCSNCPASTFSTYSNLKKHISCKHSTNAQGDDIKAQGYEAGSSEDEKVGEVKVEWEGQVKYHEGTQGDLPFKCHLCDSSFGERQEALDHIKDKHASEYDLLMSKNALDSAAVGQEETHQEEEDGEGRGKFPDYSNRKVVCAFCMRRFWSAEDLRRHMRTHTGERPFSCDICRRRFTLKHSMLRHRKKHNLSFENNDNVSDEDLSPTFEKIVEKTVNNIKEESDGNEPGDLISNLLGINDRSIIDKVLGGNADDAAKLLGVKNGVK